MRFCSESTCSKRADLRRDIRRIERPGQVAGIARRVATLVHDDAALRSQIVRSLRGGYYMEASDMISEYLNRACPSSELTIHPR